MVRIDFHEPVSAEWQKWRDTCAEKQDAVNQAVLAGKPPSISEKTYKGMRHVYFDLEGPFHGKCAYCESLIAADQPGDVEHYRPKGDLTESYRPAECTDANGQQTPHPGYYWLVYDWRNLLPACEDCNRPSKRKTNGKLVGKWGEFPVRRFRALLPGQEVQEEPLLLNPAWDDGLEDHLGFGITGVAEPLTDRGDATIELLGLNRRHALVQERARAYKEASGSLMYGCLLIISASNDAITPAEETVRGFDAGELPYSAAGRAGLREARHEARKRKEEMFLRFDV